MTIEKISNLQISLTDEVIARKWNDVIVRRNKLLSISDWTQLNDAVITKEMRNTWIRWRQKVRQVKESTVVDSDKAMELLNVLESQMPEKIQYPLIDVAEHIQPESSPAIPVDTTDVDAKIKQLKDELNNNIISMHDIESVITSRVEANTTKLVEIINHIINERIPTPNGIIPEYNFAHHKTLLLDQISKKYHAIFSEYTEVDNELFKQAVDYMVDKTPNDDQYPLLTIHFGTTDNKLDVVKTIISARNKWLQTICKLERDRLHYTNKAIKAATSEELEDISTSILND